jgi:hypothetical protein
VRKREKERNDREENNVKKKKRRKSLSFGKLAFPVSGLVWVFIFLQKTTACCSLNELVTKFVLL